MATIVTKLARPSEVELNVSITLSLADWEKVASALDNDVEFNPIAWPFFWLTSELRGQIRRAKQEFEAEREAER